MNSWIPFFLLFLSHCVKCSSDLDCDYQSQAKCHWNLDKNLKLNSLPNEPGTALLLKPTSLYGPLNITMVSPIVRQSIAASCQLVLNFRTSELDGARLIVILKHGGSELEIHKVPFLHSSKGWLTERIPLNPRKEETLRTPFQILLELVSDQVSFPPNSFAAFRSITFQNCFSESENNNDCYLKCQGNEDRCVSKRDICDLFPNCESGEDEGTNLCEKVLPFGAYCSFALHETLTDCGWTNTVTNRSHGSAPAPTWELRKVAGDEITATAVFHSRTGLIDRAVMRTIKTFNPIPRFHSLPHSMFYNSCSMSFSYLLATPNSELVIEMVTEKRDKNGNFERHLIFRDFMKSKTGEVIWKKNRSFLPVNVSQPYYIVIEATSGLKKKDSISVTNITLSKECFAINVSSSEIIAWPRESRASNGSGYGLEALILTLCLLIILAVIIFLFVILVGKFRGKLGIGLDGVGQRGTSGSTSASQLMSQSSTDVQLSRLRSGHNPLTEYNPNYEFGGSTVTLQDLREIPREKLTLVRNLGNGAFGEVYQGYIMNLPGEMIEQLPVAIKTLPEYSANNQAEMDFLVEALIMSKFEHRNIVRFIGVCFEKMPRFIVLELLPGGDLKAFLRNSRGTHRKSSQLVMGDLLVMALDVARGCQYLEDNHFIHRDIAARNCLLTSRTKSNHGKEFSTFGGTFQLSNYNNGFNSSGIITKIADFGMARDIYRCDYYKKGGKAMLPVKWMPAECFLDGIFTSKTDVWSFGVLLWEVMSMGYMPYPGRGNQEVMQFVTGGGRLSAPNGSTPPQVYSLMQECWNLNPDNRPSFATIVDRIGSFLVDQQILETALPLFSRVPSEDTTLMRPPPGSDYLVPTNPSPTYSMSSEKTELLSPDTCSTVTNDDTKLLELLDDTHSSGSGIQHNPSWKKSSIPQSIKESESGISSEGTSTIPLEEAKKPTRYVNV